MMIKKIILGVILATVVGILIYGAVLRTAETNEALSTTESGQGRGRGRASQSEVDQAVAESKFVEWVTLDGTITEVNEASMVVSTGDGKKVIIESRAWLLVKSELSDATGDAVSLLGFYEGDSFEVGKITVTSSGKVVTLRDENGYPLWSGRGRTW